MAQKTVPIDSLPFDRQVCSLRPARHLFFRTDSHLFDRQGHVSSVWIDLEDCASPPQQVSSVLLSVSISTGMQCAVCLCPSLWLSLSWRPLCVCVCVCLSVYSYICVNSHTYMQQQRIHA